jgi:hypothetical protein
MTQRKHYRLGREAGHSAGTWVIDGNTSTEQCARILRGIEDGDPEVMDMQPSPLSGEWAGESIRELFGKQPTDDQLTDYECGYSDGFWDEVARSCRASI